MAVSFDRSAALVQTAVHARAPADSRDDRVYVQTASNSQNVQSSSWRPEIHSVASSCNGLSRKAAPHTTAAVALRRTRRASNDTRTAEAACSINAAQ
jgi:hypothetical protein